MPRGVSGQVEARHDAAGWSPERRAGGQVGRTPLIVLATDACQEHGSPLPMRCVSPWRIEEVDGDEDDSDDEADGVLRPMGAERRAQVQGYVNQSKAKRLKDAPLYEAWQRREWHEDIMRRAVARTEASLGSSSCMDLLQAAREVGPVASETEDDVTSDDDDE